MAPTRRAFGVLAAGVLLCGCGGPLGGVTVAFQQYQPEPDARMAVLPFTNDTPDMDIAPAIRKGIATGFGLLGYSVMDLDECDAKLRADGITQAGQLAAVEWQKLGELVGEDLIVFGEVEEYGKTLMPLGTAVAGKTDFRSSFRMVHAPSGETLWIARGDAAGLVGQAYSMYRIRKYRLRGWGEEPLAENDEIAYALRKALTTFASKKVIVEEELALRAEPIIVIARMAGGSSVLGEGPEGRGSYGACVSIGRDRFLFDVGICAGIIPSEAVPSEDDTVVMELDLGVRRTWRQATAVHPFVSGGLSVVVTNMEEGASDPEEVVVRPYATAGVDWWLPWSFALGGQLHLSTAADWAILAFGVSVAF